MTRSIICPTCSPDLKDGPLAQVRWMAEWADRGRTGDGIGPETAGKIAKNLRAAADALERRESDARCDTAAPSDAVVEAATQAIAGHDIWRAFDADARAVLPWWLAKEAVAAAALVIRAEERAATLREVEALREAAEIALTACLEVLPLEGAWPHYRVSERIHSEVRALPEEWAEAAHAVAALAAHFNSEAE